MSVQHLLFFSAVIYLLLPAYLANMAPVIFAKLGWLEFFNLPIDQGKRLGKEAILGQGKTWRGLIAGIIVSLAVVLAQLSFQSFGWLDNIRLIDYFSINVIFFGILAGAGALIGDILKSFLKRRINIASGAAWPIFDQLDFVFGFFLFTWPLLSWPASIFWTAIIITLAGHPMTNIIGYHLNIKKVWW